MLHADTMRQIMYDVVAGTPVKDSKVKYDGEALAFREKIVANMKDLKGIPHADHEFPSFTEDELKEILARRKQNEQST